MSETVLLMRPCRWLTGQVGPPPPPLRGRPHRLTAGRGAAVPGPASTVSGNVSHCRGHVRGKNSNLFTNARKNVSLPEFKKVINLPTPVGSHLRVRLKAQVASQGISIVTL